MSARSLNSLNSLTSISLLSLVALVGCGADPAPPPNVVTPVSSAPTASATTSASTVTNPPPAKVGWDRLERAAFNRAAVRANLPLYWTVDADKDGAIDPNEVASLLFYPTSTVWAKDGAFTPEFETAYARVLEIDRDPLAGATGSVDEIKRRRLVIEDLDQGRPTLVRTDLHAGSESDRNFVHKMLAVASVIDELYAHALGVDVMASQVPKDDVASQSLLRRNWGPKCDGPKTEKEKLCSAIPGAPQPLVDVYPKSLQGDGTSSKFCETIEKDPTAKKLIDPFVVVREEKGKLIPVSLEVAYPELMQKASKALADAADAVVDKDEAPLKAYLKAASKSFATNKWLGADEAWAKMSATNSKWYVRVAPDETYWEPCSHKAGFHVTFAKINRDSIAWQDKLSPHRQEMETTLAKLIGKDYKARKVDFHLPDFIDIVINAGDDRDSFGATIGQSLPNWGPVADGRGRTVAMSNLYTDPDSMSAHREMASSLLSTESLTAYVDDPTPGLIGTILHEATHNLGPAHEYKVKGQIDEQVFGGDLAAMLEELKAQTGGLYFIEVLRKKGIFTDQLARQTYADSLVWTFGHVAQGMTSASGQRKPYSQLAAIQLGFLLEEKAIEWDAKAKAANGKDDGAFVFHYEKLAASIEKLMQIVGKIKATGDKAGAEALAKKYVEGDAVPQKVVTERVLRSPKASFVYAIDY